MRKVTEDLIPEKQFAKEFGRTHRTIQRWRAERIGPPYIKVGNRVFYRREAIDEWLLSLEQKQPRAKKAA